MEAGCIRAWIQSGCGHVVATGCSRAWSYTRRGHGCCENGMQWSMDGIRMWFRWDAIEHGCNQDVGQNDIVMGISGAWTSCCSGHFGHECIQNKVAHGLPSSWMHRASDALKHELSKCGQGCSVNPCASNRAKVWQGLECFSERDALQHGRGQHAGMNVDGMGCNREDVGKMWAQTGA